MLNKTINLLVFSLTLTAVLHFLFLRFDSYYSYSWIDIPVHFLGGVVIASLYFWLASFVPKLSQPTWSRMLAVIMVVGIGWELWEVFVGAADMSKFDYASDTLQDMINDTLGALAVWYWYVNISNKHNSETVCQK
jgi:hypothetical protein